MIRSAFFTRSMKCTEKNCRKKRAKHRTICSMHHGRKQKERNPIRYAFGKLKNNAKRRNKLFELTFEQFSEFAIRTQYIFGKGRKSDSMHIDRIDESKGYTIDNIQVMTNAENVKKYLKFAHDEHGKPINFHFAKQTQTDPNTCPF